MKIRHPLLIKVAGFLGAWIVRLWITTVRYRHHGLGRSRLPGHPTLRAYYIYAFWHENILLPAYHCGRPDVWVLVSQHADGQLIAEVCRRLGFQLVRGSTTRGSIEAVRQMVRAGRAGHLALTPDGPRGPRRRVQAGVIYLAAKTGLPIIAGGVGFQDPWRLPSWDRFVLPRPLRRATLVTSAPIRIPPDLDKEQLEHYRRLVEETLSDVTDKAERWAQTGGPRPATSRGQARRAGESSVHRDDTGDRNGSTAV